MASGISYDASAWVRVDEGEDQPVNITVYTHDADGDHWTWVAWDTTSAGEWTELSGTWTPAPSGDLTSVRIYVEGPPVGVDLYVDDVALVPHCD